MATSENRLVARIREHVHELLQAGRSVEAIKFYREATLTSLLVAKQSVESFQAGASLPTPEEKMGAFYAFLEERDFGGAAASLCLGEATPREALAMMLRIASVLQVDIRALELPTSIGGGLESVGEAQAVVKERAMSMVRERMEKRLVGSGVDPAEAVRLVHEALAGLTQGAGVSGDAEVVSLEGLDPEEARVVRLLQGPVPLEWPSTSDSSFHDKVPSGGSSVTQELSEKVTGRRYRQVGQLATVAYGLLVLVGLLVLGYSFMSIPRPRPFSMQEHLSVSDQEMRIAAWKESNLGGTRGWLMSSSEDPFFPVKLEPDLPLAYADEVWAWDKKLEAINVSAADSVSRLQRCHELLFGLYGVAMGLALFHGYWRDIISGVLMVFMGVLGLPWVMTQVWRLEFDQVWWLGPLVFPGMVALVAAILDLVLIPPRTDRRKELRAFWMAAAACLFSGLILGWAILDGNHVRYGAGVGFLGGAWLMVFHGWRWVRSR